MTGKLTIGESDIRMLSSALKIRVAKSATIIAFLMMPSIDANAMQLLSIQKLNLNPTDYISGFQIQTWNIRVRAVCKLPIGWVVTAGRDLDQEGEINGVASGFMVNMNSKEMDFLHELALIDMPSSELERHHNQSNAFKGFVIVGSYKHPREAAHNVKLTPKNIILRSATQCPVLNK